MNRLRDERAILGIDPSSRGLAFSFFEAGRLLDWGLHRMSTDQLTAVDELLDRYRPDVVILEEPDALRSERRSSMRRLLRRTSAHAASRGIAVVAVSRHEVRQVWAQRGVTSKYVAAAQIARVFPEVDYLVLPPRKSFDTEQARADIFDAISLIVHVFGTEPDDTGDIEIAAA